MSYKNRDDRIAYHKEYRRKKGLRGPAKELTKEERLERASIYNRKHYDSNRERLKVSAYLKQQKIKREALKGYHSQCSICGEAEIEFLTLDHVKEDGNEHRKNVKNNIYLWAVKQKYPDTLQCLCFNCNIKKSLKLRYKEEVSAPARTRRRQRERILSHYGKICSCCGEADLLKLTIDHVDGGGCKHRKESRGNIYKQIIDAGFPSSYRILCANCNHSARMGQGVCTHSRKSFTDATDKYRSMGIMHARDCSIDVSKENVILHGDKLHSLISSAIIECNISEPRKRVTLDYALMDFRNLLSETCYIEKNQRVGMAASNYFHEDAMWENEFNGLRPADAWKDKKVIEDTCKGVALAKGHGITAVNLRRYFLLNVGFPSQFRPAVAKALYNTYANGGSVFDPCAGWGDRLTGFWASSAASYVGLEPNGSLHAVYTAQAEAYSTVVGKNYKVIRCRVEDVGDVGHFSFGFTSPPYWTLERYNGEGVLNYSSWRDGFLTKLIETMYKTCDVFALNIKNVRDKPLIEDTMSIAKLIGARHITTHKYALPRRPYAPKDSVPRWEPILVFSS